MKNEITSLMDRYDEFMQADMPYRKFSYEDFCNKESALCSRGIFSVYGRGMSYEQREIKALKYGHGNIKVLAWSQMHGNEPISTLALLDAINYLETNDNLSDVIANKITLVVIPLLNPDGHIIFDRRNAQGIDINRDARSLVSPEAKMLSEICNRLMPKYALNIHDQELYYTVGKNGQPTLVSMLAPQCDTLDTVSEARARSMKLIDAIAHCIEPIAHNRVAKYNDVYTPTAFGDTFMRKGVSSVLIEAGAERGDIQRNISRKAVCMSILSALAVIAGEMQDGTQEGYESLPDNCRYNAFDLMLRGLKVIGETGEYTVDIGIRRIKPSYNPEDFTDDFDDYRIMNIGDLADFGAIIEYNAEGCNLVGSYTVLRIGHKANFDIIDKNGKVFNVSSLL